VISAAYRRPRLRRAQAVEHKLYRLLSEQLHFDYVIRFRGNIQVTAADGETRTAAAWVRPGGRAYVLHGAKVTAEHYEIGTVVCVRETDMTQAWCLATNKALKVTAVLDPAAVASITVPNGQPKFTLRITAAGRTYAADLNAKSLRRCIAAIGEAGPDGAAVILQGKLNGDTILEAGIVAQPKTPKPAAADAA